jgi:glycosyltransferase involved in cell wall biosynthesis
MLLAMAGWIRACRIVIAPRGEFSPGALGLKRWRKRAAIEVLRHLPVYRHALWHASSALEERNIREQIGDVAVDVALPIATLGTEAVTQAAPKQPGSVRLICLSRISPKKNMLGALRMLQTVSAHVEFNIYGPAEDEAYLAQCRAAIEKLPANIRVNLHSPVDHAKVAGLFASHHLFYFPTLGENYGHVICEALAAGCPALLSDQTPWRGLESRGAGWDLPLAAPERFRAAIERVAAMDGHEFRAAAGQARRFAREFTAADEQVARMRAILTGATL